MFRTEIFSLPMSHASNLDTLSLAMSRLTVSQPPIVPPVSNAVPKATPNLELLDKVVFGIVASFAQDNETAESFSTLAGSRSYYYIDNNCTYRNGLLHSINDEPAIVLSDGTCQWYKNGQMHRDPNPITGITKPAAVYPDGTKMWYKHGERHRDNDEPAVEDSNGCYSWYKNGKLHRDPNPITGKVGPAIIYPDGSQFWYWENIAHRDNDEPASVYADGAKIWYKNNRRHRDPNPITGEVGPAVIEASGTQKWYKHDRLHRDPDVEGGDVGPAVIAEDGTMYWYKHGERHRDMYYDPDEMCYKLQPAILFPDGTRHYYIDGVRHYSQSDDGWYDDN